MIRIEDRGGSWELGAGRGYRREQLGSSLQTGIRRDGGGFNVLSQRCRQIYRLLQGCGTGGQTEMKSVSARYGCLTNHPKRQWLTRRIIYYFSQSCGLTRQFFLGSHVGFAQAADFSQQIQGGQVCLGKSDGCTSLHVVFHLRFFTAWQSQGSKGAKVEAAKPDVAQAPERIHHLCHILLAKENMCQAQGQVMEKQTPPLDCRCCRILQQSVSIHDKKVGLFIPDFQLRRHSSQVHG